MTLSRPNILKLALPAFVFVMALLVFGASNGPSIPALGARDDAPPPPAGSTDEQIRRLQDIVRSAPDDARGYGALGDAYLQRMRETGNPGYYSRAETAFREALQRDPRDLTGVIGTGTLALARHDFSAALEYGLRARRLAPDVVRPYTVIADAQIELGRYGAAAQTLQRLIDLKPTLASYARVSYFRELNGDIPGAVEAMRLAVSAGGDAPENVAYVQTLLGNLEFNRRRLGAAREAYRTALGRFPEYVPAAAGLARLDAAEGRFESATRRYRALVERLPLPEYVIALGETELAAGRTAAGRRDLELVEAQKRLLGAAGVNTDVEFAIFEADHGDPDDAVELGRRALEAAPSVRSADALGWALTSAGRPRQGLTYAERALELGSRDPFFLYHAGVSAKAAGRPGAARRYLEHALAVNSRFSPYHAPRAERALRSVR